MVENLVIKVGEKEFPVVKTGRAQAEQVAALGKWVDAHGAGIQIEEITTGFDLIRVLTSSLSADALIDLFVVVTGCTKAEANEHFDVGDLVEAAVAVYENQTAIKRLLNRFFSPESSEPNTATELSTSSE